jgi:nucleotide-binding universal stress UspA family protein
MNTVYACIDGLANTDAVIDWSAWAARRLAARLEFLHVLERHPERAGAHDLSGAIGLGAQESLLRELSDQDERRSKLARDAGRRLLAAARERAVAAGVDQLDARLRHGDFVETVREMEPQARLFVLGEHHHAGAASRVHLDHHVEKVIRSVARPVLVATTEGFGAPRRAVFAFDGSPTARRNLEQAARDPLLQGLPLLVVRVGDDSTLARRQLEEARLALQDAGITAETELAPGAPETVLPALVRAQAPALLVIGAYRHSRLRQFLLGSTTSTLLRVSDVPVLVLR